MKKTVFILVIVLFCIGLVSIISTKGSSNQIVKEGVDSEKLVATIYKEPTCGCCGVYSSYMKAEGYSVDIKNMEDLSPIKEELGIPNELLSCHTTEIANYVLEGHVPNEAIEKLLIEKPDIKGIGMAGMPSGSPGMPGPKTEDFMIYEINNDGTAGKIFLTI